MHKVLYVLLIGVLSCGDSGGSKPEGKTANAGGITNNTETNNVPIMGVAALQAPAEVLFPRVSPVVPETQNLEWKVIELANRGSEPLVIYRVEIEGQDSPFRVSYPKTQGSQPDEDSNVAPGTVGSGAAFLIRVYFNPTSTALAESELVIVTSDNEEPEVAVSLRGNFGPCLVGPSDPLDFGRIVVGETVTQSIGLMNCHSHEPLNLSVETLGEGFQVEEVSEPIPADGSVEVNVMFSPNAPSPFDGDFLVRYGDESLRVPLVGEGFYECPKAHAQGRVQNAAGTLTNPYEQIVEPYPSQYIELDASLSSSPNGEIVEYEWTIVQKPTGSSVAFSPSNTAANPTLFLDRLGRYVVELRVVDEVGMEGCDDYVERRVTIMTVDPTDVLVELTWDTPADADQNDETGADLDLHYMHPNGRWNNAPWDIFWRNQTSDWGSSGSSDDPSLDLDDPDGAGPEILTHNNLESGLSYQIGVYYYSDRGLGPSFATVRIFINGVETNVYSNEEMAGTGTFWRLGAISWPSASVFFINQKQRGFPGTAP